MKSVELRVDGMSCAHCEMRVKSALESIDGVESAEPDAKKGNVIVKYSGDAPMEEFSTVLEGIGYSLKR